MAEDIVAFIRARLDEDAEIVETIRSGGFPAPTWATELSRSRSWHVLREVDDPTPIGYITDGRWEVRHVARHDPARVLRGVEAKRRIVAEHAPFHADDEDETLHVRAQTHEFGCRACHYSGLGEVRGVGLCVTLRLLASEWSTHDDYREEWAP